MGNDGGEECGLRRRGGGGWAGEGGGGGGVWRRGGVCVGRVVGPKGCKAAV